MFPAAYLGNAAPSVAGALTPRKKPLPGEPGYIPDGTTPNMTGSAPQPMAELAARPSIEAGKMPEPMIPPALPMADLGPRSTVPNRPPEPAYQPELSAISIPREIANNAPTPATNMLQPRGISDLGMTPATAGQEGRINDMNGRGMWDERRMTEPQAPGALSPRDAVRPYDIANQARKDVGEQKHRGILRTLGDVALGFAGGGIGGAIAGGIAGGDYRYQNTVAQRERELTDAYGQQRQAQAGELQARKTTAEIGALDDKYDVERQKAATAARNAGTGEAKVELGKLSLKERAANNMAKMSVSELDQATKTFDKFANTGEKLPPDVAKRLNLSPDTIVERIDEGTFQLKELESGQVVTFDTRTREWKNADGLRSIPRMSGATLGAQANADALAAVEKGGGVNAAGETMTTGFRSYIGVDPKTLTPEQLKQKETEYTLGFNKPAYEAATKSSAYQSEQVKAMGKRANPAPAATDTPPTDTPTTPEQKLAKIDADIASYKEELNNPDLRPSEKVQIERVLKSAATARMHIANAQRGAK